MRECMNNGGVWPSQCPVNAPSSLHTTLRGLPYHLSRTTAKAPAQARPDKHMWFITVIAVVSVANVPKSILVLHTHHAAVFPPIPVTTIGLSASVLTGNAFSDEKGAPFLSWDRHSFYILAVTPPGSREVSSLLTALRALRGGLLLLHTNTFC